MRTIYYLLVAGLLAALGACSGSSEPMAVQITGPLGPPTDPAVVTGQAAEEGIVCDAAMFEELYFVDLDGKILTEEEANQLKQVEMETGEIVFSAKYDKWSCTDGSGYFVMAGTGTLPPADYDFEGINEVATWTVDSGTGDYEKLSGTGSIEVDFARGTVTYIGELEKG
ncbi:MAG: hypothetical protein KJP22_03535 [Acidimicrobiia bacterium]|nr:hypothetical protein [Acidimicrobiia bacterium]NNK49552.1 hypothetical protein [Gemmatimonadota bacterium]